MINYGTLFPEISYCFQSIFQFVVILESLVCKPSSFFCVLQLHVDKMFNITLKILIWFLQHSVAFVLESIITLWKKRELSLTTLIRQYQPRKPCDDLSSKNYKLNYIKTKFSFCG